MNNVVSSDQGSAAFWYNYRLDGSRDMYTWHGGCPVLLGSKWGKKNWIYSKLVPVSSDYLYAYTFVGQYTVEFIASETVGVFFSAPFSHCCYFITSLPKFHPYKTLKMSKSLTSLA